MPGRAPSCSAHMQHMLVLCHPPAPSIMWVPSSCYVIMRVGRFPLPCVVLSVALSGIIPYSRLQRPQISTSSTSPSYIRSAVSHPFRRTQSYRRTMMQWCAEHQPPLFSFLTTTSLSAHDRQVTRPDGLPCISVNHIGTISFAALCACPSMWCEGAHTHRLAKARVMRGVFFPLCPHLSLCTISFAV